MKISSKKELSLAIFAGEDSIPTNRFVNIAQPGVYKYVLACLAIY